MQCYRKDYPRPQFVRENWVNLNGAWDFSFDDQNKGEDEKWYDAFPAEKKIIVPYTYETKASGIQEESRHDYIWYRKSILVSDTELRNHSLMLHFEGSDYHTKVWVNGQMAGSHTGGYSRFSFDISALVNKGQNEIIVRVEDSADTAQPRGKQRWKHENFGCWYVQTTGIWKTVWMEYVPKYHLASVKITPILTEQAVELEFDVDAAEIGEELCIEAIASFDGKFVNKSVTYVRDRHVTTKLSVFADDYYDRIGVKYWSPEEPNLYDLEFRLVSHQQVQDVVKSYFGLREIRIENHNILFNGAPLYQRMILDQGYWKDSHLTPPSEEALIEDIDKILQLGYNSLRKHQKIEDERFLYWCDVKGMLVWSEAPAAYRYHDNAVTQFITEWMEMVKQNYNHPCIITWTPVNESWGVPNVEVDRTQQHFTEAIYHLTKALDKNRPVIVNDGWEHTISDIITLHDYEELGSNFFQRYSERKDQILSTEQYHCNSKSAFANGYSYQGQPIIISEYGGIAFDQGKEGWGYGNKVRDEEEFIRRFDDITTAIKKIPYICGYCYTQVTDVQQEINGLMDSERNFKVNPDTVREINTRKIGYWHL